MNTGDLLLLKEGILGLRKGENLGIYLGREKGGKQYLYLVFTPRGKQKVKQSNVVRTLPGFSYRGQLDDLEGMRRFLKREVIPKFLKQEGRKLDLSPRNIQKHTTLEQLWNATLAFLDWNYEKQQAALPNAQVESLGLSGFSVAEIAAVYFFPKVPMEEHVGAVRSILTPCEDPGHVYFQRRGGGKRERYFPYAREEMAGVLAHVERLNALKACFVEWVEEEVEMEESEGKAEYYYDDAGKRHRKKPRTRRVPKLLVPDPAETQLPGELETELGTVLEWCRLYLENAGWNWKSEKGPAFGLGGTNVRILKGFSLEKYLHFFAVDMAQNSKLELVSGFIELLLIFKHLNYQDASKLLIRNFLVSGQVHFHLAFKKAQLLQAERLPDVVSEEDMKGRRDLTALETYTIDPPDAKDFDDAVGFRRLVDGHPENPLRDREVLELWVHIADVANYVRPESAIDDEARFRATSVYLPTGVLPMLPHKLSDHLCSLVADDIRLAVSTRMLFDPENFEMLHKEHHNSFIRVDENLSYDQVNSWIEEEREPFTGMCAFSKGLEQRFKRLSLETQERKLRFSDDGESFDVTLKHPSNSTRMIEQFMVVTNEAVADTFNEESLFGLFRIHPLPEQQKVANFNELCQSLGYEDVGIEVDWEALNAGEGGEDEPAQAKEDSGVLGALLSGGKISLGGFSFKEDQEEEDQGPEDVEEKPGKKESGFHMPPMDPEKLEILTKAFNKTLGTIRAKEEDLKYMLSGRILRTMPRALYSLSNHGHFGLNSQSYCHFTSPIRRYPDVLIHRALKCLIYERESQFCPWYPPEAEEIESMTEICNDQSRSAEDLERLMVDIALAMRTSREKELREKSYHGMVSGLTAGSIFVNMDGISEGRIPMSKLGTREQLELAEGEGRVLKIDELTGEEEEVLRLGQRIPCKVYSVDIAQGRIELSFKP